MHWLSTTVQLLGTIVTCYGLFYAYGRARRLPARLREWWDHVRHGPHNATVATATMGVRASMSADAHIAFTLDENATADEKFAQVQKYLQELRALFGPINAAINRIDKEIKQAKEHADTVAAQALTDAKAELQRFDARLNQVQSVDLRIAAGGAFVMAVGYVLSYFSCFRY